MASEAISREQLRERGQERARDRLTEYVQRVAAGMAQSDRCGGGKGHVHAFELRAVVQLRAGHEERLRTVLAEHGGTVAVVGEALPAAGWTEVSEGVWAPVEGR